MKFSFALIAVFCLASALPAQTPPTAASQQSQHEPGVAKPAAPSHTPGQAATTPSEATAQVDPAKDAAIRHLMEITETSKLGDNIATYLQNQVHDGVGHAMAPEKVDAFMGTFNQKFAATSAPNQVTDAMVPIYAKAFSMDDIQELIQFYESPLGQRVVKALPDVVQQSQQQGIQIEQTSAIKVLRDMTAEYPELKQLLPPEGGSGAPGSNAPGAGAAPTPAPPSASPQK